MCQHSYEYEGHRTYGANIPGYAQGMYFPGDEPGTRCNLTGDPCTPEDCAAMKPTEWLCPACQQEEEDSYLRKSVDDGSYHCRRCESQWTEVELAQAFKELLILLGREKEDAEDAYQQAHEEKSRLYDVLGKVREALEVAA